MSPFWESTSLSHLALSTRHRRPLITAWESFRCLILWKCTTPNRLKSQLWISAWMMPENPFKIPILKCKQHNSRNRFRFSTSPHAVSSVSLDCNVLIDLSEVSISTLLQTSDIRRYSPSVTSFRTNFLAVPANHRQNIHFCWRRMSDLCSLATLSMFFEAKCCILCWFRKRDN